MVLNKYSLSKNFPQTYTVDSVDEGVVAAVAHGEPVEGNVHDVDIFPRVDGRMDDGGDKVDLPGRPAQDEHHHHDEHHVQDPLLVLQDLVVSDPVCLAGGDGPPELHCHPDVGNHDD